MAKAQINKGIETVGVQNWGDIARIDAYDIFFAAGKKGTGSYFDMVMTKASNEARKLSPVDTGLLVSTIRYKYDVSNYGTINFRILAGATGAVKDYYNTAFQKTEPQTYMRRSSAIDKRTTELWKYPAIMEEQHHYLERGLNSQAPRIQEAYLAAYEDAVVELSKKGKK